MKKGDKKKKKKVTEEGVEPNASDLESDALPYNPFYSWLK